MGRPRGLTMIELKDSNSLPGVFLVTGKLESRDETQVNELALEPWPMSNRWQWLGRLRSASCPPGMAKDLSDVGAMKWADGCGCQNQWDPTLGLVHHRF